MPPEYRGICKRNVANSAMISARRSEQKVHTFDLSLELIVVVLFTSVKSQLLLDTTSFGLAATTTHYSSCLSCARHGHHLEHMI